MIASMNRSKLNRNTPAVTTNNLNGNGGGNNVATNTANHVVTLDPILHSLLFRFRKPVQRARARASRTR
jgi:hypothetical protein